MSKLKYLANEPVTVMRTHHGRLFSTIRYDTIKEFNVDSKAEYTA